MLPSARVSRTSMIQSGATPLRLGLTLGDLAGIGPEVSVQALLQTDLHRRCLVRIYVVAEHQDWLRATCQRYGLLGGTPIPDAGLQIVPVECAVHSGPQRPGLTSEASQAHAFAALEAMADAAVLGEIDAMVTGPVPKSIFDHLTPRPPGQTEFLAHRLGAKRFAMMLAGPRLRVVPVTTHIGLRDVAGALTTQGIVDCGLAAVDALTRWMELSAPRLAICALNPHAGEGGRLGDEEERIIVPAVEQLRELGIHAEGPHVADTVFYRAMNGRFDAVLCMYHDQALGPLKTVHFHDAVNLTCGLPIPRLSPDHGTAYDIAGRGTADPTSMVQALARAERMASRAALQLNRPVA
jgi:4-hydroxythreonine-4-phosphate dehydrogenase